MLSRYIYLKTEADFIVIRHNIFISLIIKRFYTRGTLTSKRIPRLAKISIIYRDWLRFLKQERVII